MFGLNRKVLCLDWDKRSLRLVIARVGQGRMVLDDAHSYLLPEGLDADDPPAMGEFIERMLRRRRQRPRLVLVDVPRERAVINRLSLPPTPDNEVAAAVRFQAMRELPFPLETASADYVITKRDEQGLAVEALLAAVTLETLNRVREACAAAGLTPARIGLRPYANLVSVQHLREVKERCVLFVDVGPGATEIDIFAQGALAFVRSANVTVPLPTTTEAAGEGSRVITRDDLEGVGIPPEAKQAAVDELLVEVTRTLQAYRATQPDVTLDGAIVAGMTGIESQLADALFRRIGTPAELFDPTGALGEDPAEAPKLRSFSAALGLAWGMSREGLLALDFLNPKKPISSREVLQRKVRLGVLAACVLLVAVGGAFGRYYLNLKSERDALVKHNSTLRKDVDKKVEVQHQIERAQEWEVAALWPDELLAVTQAAVEPGKRMLIQGLDLECGSRTQMISLRSVHVTDWRVPAEFAHALNEMRRDGQPLYEATPLVYSQIKKGDFKGKLDIHVELRKLQKEQQEIQKREKERKGRKG